jgi:macrolide transport system ATP-binding/permease protein
VNDRLQKALNRLRAFLHKQPIGHELDLGMAAHLELAIQIHLRRGHSPEEARRQALVSLGGIEPANEHHRDGRGS